MNSYSGKYAKIRPVVIVFAHIPAPEILDFIYTNLNRSQGICVMVGYLYITFT